uniref:Uncharacterized protein n=1 Tax=Anguilla anguilla TaxID=7936 RepID=A0A0E9P9L9_ANGAN
MCRVIRRERGGGSGSGHASVRAGCQDLKKSSKVGESNSSVGNIAVPESGCRLGC